ncbi:MAG TPA: DUF1353 domain-containing protein [Bacteroidales bacterium]|nr:DUF1353 domain-containing protein [Bacteroidales bacterium]
MMEAHPIDEQGLPLIFYKRKDGETVAVLQKDMAYYTSKGLILVPKGFESDGCSMPRFFWRVFGHPFDMQYLREAILHDWLYKTQIFDRKTADLIFREELQKSAQFARDTVRMQILEDLPSITDRDLDKEYKRRLKKVKVLSDWKIACIYRGLRLGGWKAWNDHKKAKEMAA